MGHTYFYTVRKRRNTITGFITMTIQMFLFWIVSLYCNGKGGCDSTDATIFSASWGKRFYLNVILLTETLRYKFRTTLNSSSGFSNLSAATSPFIVVKTVENGQTTMSCILKFTHVKLLLVLNFLYTRCVEFSYKFINALHKKTTSRKYLGFG